MTERVVVFDEPRLEFADGQCASDPHDGLALFGPYSRDRDTGSFASYIVIGTQEGTELWREWSTAFDLAWVSRTKDLRLWPPFPGFEAAFGSRWPLKAAREFNIGREELLKAARMGDVHERCYAVVELFLARLHLARKLDSKPSVAVCVIPDEVWKNCRPESRVDVPTSEKLHSTLKKRRQSGQLEIFDFNQEQYLLAPDFRRQLKARSMALDIPLQIVRESTLRISDDYVLGERSLTPVSDRMWNIGTALYYKGGGKPWRLADARPGVCYVGIAFRRTPAKDTTACCAAQMFLDSGDGIVFLGENGPWYSPADESFHLSPEAAESLLRGVLTTYSGLKSPHDPPLHEIFLHSRSWISPGEFEGYRRACPPNCRIVGVSVRRDSTGPRLYRNGTRPVLRGTFWQLGPRLGLLYCSGFKPRLATYDGWETPVPLRVTLQYGDADPYHVARDILSLSKLNYNACRLGEGSPITVRFSDSVGEILVSNPTVTERSPLFKYYI